MHGSRHDHLVCELAERLGRAEHVVVYGPSGIGKSTLLRELGARLTAIGVQWSMAPKAESLRDVVLALESLYPDGRGGGLLSPQRVRAQFCNVAETSRGALLLDHVAGVGTALKGFLRSLRGTRLGIAFAVDIDAPRDKDRMRRWCLSHREFSVPPASSTRLRQMLVRANVELGEPLSSEAIAHLVEAAQGRPGYITVCLELLRDRRYWNGGRVHLTLLENDSEIGTRNRGGWRRVPMVIRHPTRGT
ncbi:MAG TPA: ATP-binding protein [Polyangiaceae bacterium]|nr:ATP-binding protein [Polyangiaceae bacterium]